MLLSSWLQLTRFFQSSSRVCLPGVVGCQLLVRRRRNNGVLVQGITLEEIEKGDKKGSFSRIGQFTETKWLIAVINHRMGQPLDADIKSKPDLGCPELADLVRVITIV